MILGTAIENYRIDNNTYPFCNNFGHAFPVDDGSIPVDQNGPALLLITTPIAYVSAIPQTAYPAESRRSAALAADIVQSSIVNAPGPVGTSKSYYYASLNSEGLTTLPPLMVGGSEKPATASDSLTSGDVWIAE